MKKCNRPFLAETSAVKRSFTTLAEAVAWVKDTLTQQGYTDIEIQEGLDDYDDENDVDFVNFWAQKDGRQLDAAVIENRNFEM